MTQTDYKADSIVVLRHLETVRKAYNPEFLEEQRNNFKTKTELANHLNMSIPTLSRALNENRFLKKFPNLEKSKTQILNKLKTEKEIEEFTNFNNIHTLSFREINKRIDRWKNDLEKNPKILLNDIQHDILIGSSFGDGNLRKRWGLTYFRTGHSERQKEYVHWLYSQFSEFVKKQELKEKRRVSRKYKMIDFTTISHNVFNYYHSLFYKDKKKLITKAALQQLTPRSLAIWVCDDGSYCKKLRYIILCTNSFSLKEHKLIQEYLNQKWGLNPKILFRDKKYYYLKFSVEETKKLIKIIKDFIPVKKMMYKIGKQNG